MSWKRRNSMPQAIKRNFAYNGDGKRVDQFTDILTNQRSAYDHTAILIHNHFRVALIAVRQDMRAGDMAHVVFHGTNAQAGLPGLRFGEPNAADFGIGEDHLRHGHMVGGGGPPASRALADPFSSPFARAAIASPHTRAWYLPMCVNKTR